jgi:hypothetical protein
MSQPEQFDILILGTRSWRRDWDPCLKVFHRDLFQPKWDNRLLQLRSRPPVRFRRMG